jgi:hypothetical protein
VFKSYLRYRVFGVRCGRYAPTPKSTNNRSPTRISFIILVFCTLSTRRITVWGPPHVDCLIYSWHGDFFYSLKSPALLRQHLQYYLVTLTNWSRRWKITINAGRSIALFITKRTTPLPPLTFENKVIPWCPQAKYLGVIIDNKLSRRPHVNYIVAKVKGGRFELYPYLCARSILSLHNKWRLHLLCTRPIMTDVSTAWAYNHRQ